MTGLATRPSRVLAMAGVCHRTTSVAAREECAFGDGGALLALRALRADGTAREALALATCNRIELYAAGDDPRALEERLRAVLGAGPRATVRHGSAAAAHLIRVAAGLESRVPGDDGIRRQLRDAAALAREAGASGPVLNRLTDAALGAGRRIRGARAGGSVAACAARVAADRLGGLRGCPALVVGTGAVGRAVARDLGAAGAAVRAGGRTLTADPERLATSLSAVELVVCATSSAAPVLGAAAVAAARPEGRPLLVLDLALPRDVEPAVGALPGVTLLDVDAVAGAGPRADDPAGAALAVAAAAEWGRWFEGAGAGPAIAAMREAEEHRQRRELASLPAGRRAAARREGARRLHLMTLALRSRAVGPVALARVGPEAS